MPARLRPLGALALVLLLSACIFFPFPPMVGAELVVENATDTNWVLRLVTAGFPQELAVPAGETGTAPLYAGTPSSIVLLDTDCEQVDELDWTDASQAVRIEGDGQLAAIDEPAAEEDRQVLIDYFECMTGFGPAPTAGGPVAEASGTIFVSGGEGAGWQIDPATAELSEIAATATIPLESEHTLSPDGSLIAFTRFSEIDPSTDIIVTDSDGGAERVLVENAGTPVWSPDGTRIAYLNLDPFSGGAALSVIDLAGGEPVALGEDATAMRWSPDGQLIAFIAMDFGGFNQPTFGPSELKVVSVDGTGLRTLAEASPFAPRPSWSPDGARIAFSAGSETQGFIAVVDAAGGDVVTTAEIEGAILSEAAWHPEGAQIAFTISSAGFFTAEGAIGIVPADGGDVQRIGALENAFYQTPTWSPDGAWLAAVRSGGVEITSDLVVFDAGSGDEITLATGVLGLTEWRD